MGEHGDGACVRNKEQLDGEYVHPIRVGITPRPWGCCWTYEPKIKITPPVWCWKMQEDTMFGLELKPKRNGSRRKAKLDCVMIHKGRPVYCMVVETSDGESRRYYDSIPVLDPYFAPIWPAAAEETPAVAEPAPERDTGADTLDAAAFAVGGIIHTPGLELEADPGELIVPPDQLRRVLTASNTADLVAAYLAQADEDAPDSWTGTENRPPGACIGGQTPFSGKYYYYVWFEEPPTEGEAHEQKAGLQHPARQTGRHKETGTPGLCHCPKSPQPSCNDWQRWPQRLPRKLYPAPV